MNRILSMTLLIISSSVFAQTEKDITIFHRILILNPENEMMVVKIENSDFWVTPGFYQDSNQTIKEGLETLGLTYGMVIEEIKLNGVFVLQRDINGEKSTSLRNVYTCGASYSTIKKPEGIAEIRWLSVNEATKLITFPHINDMIEKVMNNPDEVWGGSLLQYKEGNKWQSKVLEEFYTF